MNTEEKDLIPMYSLKDLAELEWKARQTVKNSNRYIKVKLETWSSKAQYTYWTTKKPYGVRYIRLEDIKKVLKGKVDISFIS